MLPVPLDTLSAFIGLCVVLAVTPGPDMLFITANALSGGSRAGVAAMLGTAVGSVFHATMAALGLSAIVAASPLAYEIIRYAGAAYLVWLGIQAIRNPSMLQMQAERMRGRRLLAVFRGGVISNVLNPKVLVFVLALLPPFVHPELGQAGLQFAILGGIFVVTLAAFNLPIALSGGAIGRMLAARPGMARFQGRFSGVIFIGLALHVAATGQRA